VALLAFLLDEDADRREAFRRALPAPLPGLRRDTIASGPFLAVWEVFPGAPVRASEGGVVVGEAGGYFAAARYDPRAGLTVEGDLLGVFPVYWWAADGAVLCASSPEWFAAHPRFRPALDPRGLAGLLLTHGLVEGRTLLAGVARLPPARRLVARAGAPPRLADAEGPRFDETLARAPYAEQLDALDAALAGAVARAAGDGRGLGLLLSGGRDSRLVAGYARARGLAPQALTLGRRGDDELYCARAVARALRLPHAAADVPSGGYGAWAERAARLEHAAHGVSLLHSWWTVEPLRRLAPRTLGGFLMDASLGGSLCVPGTPSFEADFARLNAWGLPPGTLRALLRREVFGDAVDETVAALRAAWSARPAERAWHLYTDNRHRFNTGGPVWRHAFGSWPALPLLDRELAAVAFSLPAATVAGRRAEDDLLRRRFPALARLPVDRNGPDLTPVVPTARWRLRLALRRRLARRGAERRRFFRVTDFDGPGWREVRRLAEPERARRRDWFHGKALDALLPPAEATVGARELPQTAGLRALLLVLLWARGRF